MKQLATWLLILFMAPAAMASAPTLEQILDANAHASGDKNALANRQTVEMKLVIKEPTFVGTAHYRATRDGRMRIDIYSGVKRVFTEAFDGHHGWQQRGEDTEVTDMSPAGEAAVRRGVIGNMVLLRDRPKLGYRLSLAGMTSIGGTRYYLVDSIAPDGFAERLYINTETFLTERSREASALHPDANPAIKYYEKVQEGYARVQGIMVAARSIKFDLKTGTAVQTADVKECRFNAPFKRSVFMRPPPGHNPAP
ncbi:hypothetical protein [Kordiimonas marina]|uniref:hypothetical protein n=1 Tax=Kordiimonas marina TaxID=2872312 RepID=UPI001FF12739|nr:hypothetical protein [Kordiimonas marina]MCJ9430534.1 hypothetical protein [Kordiimonas marina]